MTPRNHAELIKCWADGATIQSRTADGGWCDIESPNWQAKEYRVKPDERAARDMAVAEAVLNWCLVARPHSQQRESINLAAIIAGIKPFDSGQVVLAGEPK